MLTQARYVLELNKNSRYLVKIEQTVNESLQKRKKFLKQ